MTAPPSGASISRVELSPINALRRSAFVYADKPAVVHGNRDQTHTYQQFAERVDRLASAMRAAGVRPGDRVAFLCPNTPALLEAHLGVPVAGGSLVAINTRLSATDIAAILRHAEARLIFVDHQSWPLVEGLDLAATRAIRVDDTGAADDPYERFLASGSATPVEAWLTDENEPIAINYTSGTTGQPKGVIYSHRGAYLNGLGNASAVGLDSDSVYLWLGPMFHCNGWCFTWGATAVAATHVCLRRIEPERVWTLLEEYGVTHCHGAPTVFISLVNHPAARRLTRPVTAAIGGAPPSPTLLAQLHEFNIRPIHAYGLTETYGPATFQAWRRAWAGLSIDEQARQLARQGQAHPTAVPVRVVDAAMQDVPRDGQTLGEVVMRGNTVMPGYYRSPDSTAAAFAGGWFHSGDLAVMHADGTIELRDRKKDIIISGGENISTIEVEQALARHPAVLECAVIAVPDPLWGERPKAFVTLKAGQQATEREIIDFCRATLAHFKCPAAVMFGELPKTSTGKVQKYLLRSREGAGDEPRVG
ncbi:MAG: AMP-binding protein [Chloroflexi bacterium]|nr:AMP-binding protein [Chloroflexota bacterium]